MDTSSGHLPDLRDRREVLSVFLDASGDPRLIVRWSRRVPPFRMLRRRLPAGGSTARLKAPGLSHLRITFPGSKEVTGSTRPALLPIALAMPERILRLRYPATCSACGSSLTKGTHASWNREAKTATCMSCLTQTPDAEAVSDAPGLEVVEINRGRAGGSAAREWRTRHDRREQAMRSRYGKLGGLVLALTEDPHSTAAWAYGANGERALGKLLDPLREEGIGVLHDRRIPGSRTNIDHIVVAPGACSSSTPRTIKGASRNATAAASSQPTTASTSAAATRLRSLRAWPNKSRQYAPRSETSMPACKSARRSALSPPTGHSFHVRSKWTVSTSSGREPSASSSAAKAHSVETIAQIERKLALTLPPA
jgi:hypothetical protein